MHVAGQNNFLTGAASSHNHALDAGRSAVNYKIGVIGQESFGGQILRLFDHPLRVKNAIQLRHQCKIDLEHAPPDELSKFFQAAAVFMTRDVKRSNTILGILFERI